MRTLAAMPATKATSALNLEPPFLGLRVPADHLIEVSMDQSYLRTVDLEFTAEDAYDTYLSSDAFVAAHRWPEHAPFDHNRLSSYDTLLSM